MNFLDFEDIKSGTILNLSNNFDLYKNACGINIICSIDCGENVIVLSKPTNETDFYSLKVLYKDKIGYLSWTHKLKCEPINNKL